MKAKGRAPLTTQGCKFRDGTLRGFVTIQYSFITIGLIFTFATTANKCSQGMLVADF